MRAIYRLGYTSLRLTADQETWGRYVFSLGAEGGGGGGGLGPQRGGSSVELSTKWRAIASFSAIQREGHTPFPEFLIGIFVM